MIPFAFEEKVVAVPAGSGGNANLTNLTISAGNLSPTFVTGTLSYTLSVPNGVTSVAVTATGPGGGQVISLNGQQLVSGVASGAVNIPVGSTALNVFVDGFGGGPGNLNNHTYVITVTRAAGTGNQPPNPSDLEYLFVNGEINTQRSVTVSNPNSQAITVSFNAFTGTDAGGPIGFSWVTLFPLTIPANTSAQVTMKYQHGFFVGPPKVDVAAGTWQCGADSGTLSAKATKLQQ